MAVAPSHTMLNRRIAFGLVSACFLVAALFAASASAAVHPNLAVAGRVPSQVDLVSAVSCTECKAIVGVVYNITENPSLLNATFDVLIDLCHAKFSNDTNLANLCVDIMKLGEGLLPLLVEGMQSLAWDIPLTFCSAVVKVCNEPCCAPGAPPEEIFINFAHPTDLSQMRVTWITLNETVGAGVEWWQSNGQGTVAQAKESTRTYTAGGWIGVIHSAVMTDLLPGTSYTYRVGGDAVLSGWSDNITFTTLPAVIGVPSRPLRVLQIADMGYAKFSNATVDRMAQYVADGKVDFIIHNGDISYADADEQHWDLFFNKIQPFASTTPYMTTPGNHELWWNFTAYQARLSMSMPPTLPPTGSGSMYYTLSVGPTEFVFMDSETWIDTGSLDAVQMAWYQAHAQALNRTQQPLLTVTHHRPLYCLLCPPHDLLSSIMRAQGEKIFLDTKVDLHLSGHWHNYQRMYPVYNFTLLSTNYTDPPAPVYIVNGAAGNREGQDGWHKAADYMANGSSDYGLSYMVYTVDEATRTATIAYEFINAVDGSVFDNFTLVKHY